GVADQAVDESDAGAVDCCLALHDVRRIGGHEDPGFDAGAGGIGGEGGGGVAGGGDGDLRDAELFRLRNRGGNAASLEAAGRVETFFFDVDGAGAKVL